jgi:hypothetical protein
MRSKFRPVLSAIALALFAGSAAAADDAPVWRPISTEELQMKAPRVEPDADAEGIFWEVWLDDKKLSSIYYEHYVRIKIFTKRGQEKFSKFDIPFTKGKKIEHIAARVIRPDGTILTLDPKDIFEREIVKAGKIKVMAKSFAIPAIEPGVIVEYKYRETFKDAWGNGIKLVFQHDIPVQRIAYHIRPQKGYKLIPSFFNMPETTFVEDATEKGFFVASLNDVPAYKVEPHMPPEDEVRKWAFVGYSVRDMALWRTVYRRYSPWLLTYASPTEVIKKKAGELTLNAATDDEKLRRIYDYVQTQIRNVDFDRLLTEEQREDLDHDHAEDTITRRMGNTIYVELLFAALAKAAGYEVNLVFSGDRSETFFSPDKYPFSSLLHLASVAVKVNSEWKYFNASTPYIPFGFQTWDHEGIIAMLVGEQGFAWRNIPISGPERSPAKRTADLSLSEDGTLDGKLKYEYFGQQAISRRRDAYRESEAKRKESFEADVKARISTAEISELVIEHFDDPSKPLTYSFKVRIPNYAQRTGQRMFFQPGVFEFGAKPLFSATSRQHSIHFAYPWSETDEIEIKLPPGFDLDSADQPPAIADPKNIASLKVAMSINRTTNVMRFRREFHFGGSGNVLFPASSYAPLKGLFDAFHKADSHIITLKQRK